MTVDTRARLRVRAERAQHTVSRAILVPASDVLTLLDALAAAEAERDLCAAALRRRDGAADPAEL